MDMLGFRLALISKMIASPVTNRIQTPALRAPDGEVRRRPLLTHKLSQREGPARTSRKRCLPCYSELADRLGTSEARKKARKPYRNALLRDSPVGHVVLYEWARDPPVGHVVVNVLISLLANR
ncbi:hypothetical protein J6590_063403 [Homalodisca vitripennis]|nr:hypothetical protein J6590_063403 [Homalodisca vitripennis]